MRSKSVFVLFLLVMVNLLSCADSITESTLLNDFFGERDYHILDEEFVTTMSKFKMAVHYIDSSMTVYDRAIVYNQTDGGFITHLLLKDMIFFNSEDQVIQDYTEHSSLKGFSSKFEYPDLDRNDALSGLRIDGHFGKDLYTSGICQYSCHKIFEIIYEASNLFRVSDEGFKYTLSECSQTAGLLLHLSGFRA